MNASIATPCHTAATGTDLSHVDISRGAAQFGIPAQVFLQRELLDDYAEFDSSLGQNVVGVVLSVLGCQLVMGGLGLGDGSLTVCLLRRNDGHEVEVDLTLRRHRLAGRECYHLSKSSEREMSR